MNFVLYAALVFFVAGLTSHRIITHILSVGLFLFLVVSFDMGIVEDLRIGYGFVPGIEDFSEISSYGIFQASANWFFLLWMSLAITLIMAGIWLWKRGSDKKWSHRLSLKNVQLGHISKFVMLGCIGVFFFLMSFITKNVYDNGNFVPEDEQERLDAEYEYKYNYLAAYPQPKYAKVDLQIDLFPSERKAIYVADISLDNTFRVDTLFLNWKDFVEVSGLKLNQQELKPVKKDTAQNLTAYLIPDKAREDTVLRMFIEGKKQYVGFVQGDFQGDLTQVGSFASIREFLPVIGYDSEKELDENRTREERGLERLSSRMAAIGDSLAQNQDFYAPDAGRVTGQITISTEAGQVPFAAGALMKKEEKEGRIVATYHIDGATVFNWHLGSSNYALAAGEANGLEYTIFHKPEHTFNIDWYKDATDKAVTYMRERFGADAVQDKLQLVEIHRWQDPFYSFANTLVISEKEGWVADTEGLQEKAYLYLTVGSGLASLWIQENVQMANVQGAEMLAEALPEAIGLQFVKEVLGEEAVQLLADKKMEQYAKDRNNEPNTEPPLVYADGAEYLEVNKGAVALYQLSEEIGSNAFTSILKDWTNQKQETRTHFKSLYDQFISQLAPRNKEAITAMFEEVD